VERRFTVPSPAPIRTPWSIVPSGVETVESKAS